ncbi:GTPase IMAP family member 4 [Chanos chanos]|uniref:GTPase IMAP family member 4 n=1 Tax=Chanos chanos TaxID=29144 RepID=A0A6J2WZJ9_CHACN|nr:GTPase IMAP family member 4-like [Chanos chanos]
MDGSLRHTDQDEEGSSGRELRLILLGRGHSGKSSVGNVVLGDQVFETHSNSETSHTEECEKRKATVAGREVSVVDTPDWFCSERPPEEIQRQLSLCVALSAPGPHAFLLCVPVHRHGDLDLQALGALEEVFGPDAISKYTLVLLTHVDLLPEGQSLEEYLSTQRKDVLELVERCGDRYHTVERGGGEEKEKKTAVELLEKVEQMVGEGGAEFYTCSLFIEAETRIRQRQEEIARQRREEGEEDVAPGQERTREEAERSVRDLRVDGINALSPPSPPPSFLLSVWNWVTGCLGRVAKLVRLEALLGSLVGLFVGGPLGGAMGATVGSVATEVGRRKRLKTK